ncbi:MAG: hypothetical protein CML03_10845 [Pseudooceanicola sp.]|nr:hypothetical protein [Pseudooceanicola sp.]
MTPAEAGQNLRAYSDIFTKQDGQGPRNVFRGFTLWRAGPIRRAKMGCFAIIIRIISPAL